MLYRPIQSYYSFHFQKQNLHALYKHLFDNQIFVVNLNHLKSPMSY
ncbi:unnamed protein product [Schistosoma curassoni]|uniref:Uncharacterized protein n=1 Tax=Schistosoma curassoni TaxID=6186 RepID=A0A183JD76_9TREM|nr:unnamed protein product [Schistosoma curassoni]